MKHLIILATAISLLASGCVPENDQNYAEYEIGALQALMEQGDLTARELVEYYLDRIDKRDRGGPALNSIIELNPDALGIADTLDLERKESGPRGPLHGIPVVLKANIDTGDQMETTAGSLALAGHRMTRLLSKHCAGQQGSTPANARVAFNTANWELVAVLLERQALKFPHVQGDSHNIFAPDPVLCGRQHLADAGEKHRLE